MGARALATGRTGALGAAGTCSGIGAGARATTAGAARRMAGVGSAGLRAGSLGLGLGLALEGRRAANSMTSVDRRAPRLAGGGGRGMRLVHTEEELLSVLETDAPILGVNNRNLNDFTVDLRTTARLMDALRSAEGEGSRIVVAESGVRSEEDAGYLAETGVDAILVGEALMRASNPEETLRSFKRKGRRAA